MTAMAAVVRYEYRMAVRRWGVWVAFALAFLMYARFWQGDADPSNSLWAQRYGMGVAIGWYAGWSALELNSIMAVVAGIAIADRLARDGRTRVRELLRATPLSNRDYVLGKYAGVVLAALTPVSAAWLIGIGSLLARGLPIAFVGPAFLAFLAIVVPAYLFVGAFSLACPALLPVRVYQVLFAGYWFWGNYVSPDRIPTLAGTWLTPCGKIVGAVFFSGAGFYPGFGAYDGLDAIGSLVVILGCTAVALVALERYLTWQAARA